jgi:predicted secreted protein
MQKDSHDQVMLQKGSWTTIKFKGLTLAGYLWNFTIDGEKDCVSVLKEFISPKNISMQNTGAGAEELFTITGIKKGSAAVHFFQRRSWEKDTSPVDERTVVVVVD